MSVCARAHAHSHPCACTCTHACVCAGLSLSCLSQKVLRRLGHRVVSSDEEESQVKPDGPSEKAWGKTKTTFYSTDFVDDELGGDLMFSPTIYVQKFLQKESGLIFADYQVEYVVSLSHCFFFEDLKFCASLQ